MNLVRLDLFDNYFKPVGKVEIRWGHVTKYTDNRDESERGLFIPNGYNGHVIGSVFMKVTETELRALKIIKKMLKRGSNVKCGFDKNSLRYSIIHVHDFGSVEDEEARELLENTEERRITNGLHMGEKLHHVLFKEHGIANHTDEVFTEIENNLKEE